jgi:hypothetical protein
MHIKIWLCRIGWAVYLPLFEYTFHFVCFVSIYCIYYTPRATHIYTYFYPRIKMSLLSSQKLLRVLYYDSK